MIRTEKLNFTVGDFALRDISFHVRPGEYFVLLGKPGSGKTLLLECLAGLNRIASGTIEVDGRRVERVEPRDRRIGYVPQDYALFSRRTVRGNIEFPLRVQGCGRGRRDARVDEIAGMLGIQHLLERDIEGLSGGERQRVALARALATRPKILLLDEPVSALDHETREGILIELRRLQQRTRTTTIHVCHDLDEMRSVADRLGILRRGRLIQVGEPQEVCSQPADPEVAGLFRLGTVLLGTAVKQQTCTRLDLGDITLFTNHHVEGKVQVLIRAREVRLEPLPSQKQHIAARVESILRGDFTTRVGLRVGATLLRAELPHDKAEAISPQQGANVALICPPEGIYIFQQKNTPR